MTKERSEVTKHMTRASLDQENATMVSGCIPPAAERPGRPSPLDTHPAAADVVIGRSVPDFDARSNYLPMRCTELSDGLSGALEYRAAMGRAWRRPRHFCFAGYISWRPRILATVCSVRKCRNHGFADLDKSCARPLDAGALAADAGAFDQQRQSVGQEIRLRNPGIAAEPRQAVALRGLEFFDEAARRMIAFGQLDRGVDHVATPAIA